MIEKISRISLILIWAYHGLVPKILFKNEQEILMNEKFIPFFEENFILLSSGIIELVYALALLIFFKSKKLLYPAIGFSILATLAILFQLPDLFKNAFNPFSTNLAVCALATINLISIKEKE